MTVSETNNPLVSIIIVNWNGVKLLQECLDAILRQTYKHYEIILVDNASKDDSVAFVENHYPQVILVRLAENTGFTGGNIAGLARATGSAIVLLNNDAVLTDRWLEVMVDGLYSDPGVGFCAARIVIAGTDLIDSVGDAFTTAFTGTKMGEYEAAGRYETQRMVPGACAAAVMYRRDMLDSIGFLDEDFFFNHEDTDLNLRAWLARWKCLYVPEAVVHHKVNASVGVLSDTGVYYFSRNNVWVWAKNVPLSLILLYLPQRLLYELSSFAYFCVIKGKWKPFIRGKIDAVRSLGKMWRKRAAILPLIRLSNSEIKRDLLPISGYLRQRLRSLH